ncbi:DUF6199 family natural product biosynthesis protein [Paenibacillus glycanilyticus]|uniref:DUF6199 family natural product biosynthesis protein n=1 Tax=Paenibacillus glycanilyticus TaxID=126569 RepID=UPI003EBB2A69
MNPVMQPKGFRLKACFTIIGIIAASAAIALFARWYFFENVLKVDGIAYKTTSNEANFITYKSSYGPDIKVVIKDPVREVYIEEEIFRVIRSQGPESTEYKVEYADGHYYTIVDQDGSLMTYDERGEPSIMIAAYEGNKRILGENDERYWPSWIMLAAYPEYQPERGNLIAFIGALVLMVYGWCLFKYEWFQNFLFLISLKWIWTNSQEPSDFYYFSSKAGGIVVIVLAMSLLIKSLSY